MKSIERRFLGNVHRFPLWSTYICFASAIKGQKFNYRVIKNWFNKLVDPDDYASKDKRAILNHLKNL